MAAATIKSFQKGGAQGRPHLKEFPTHSSCLVRLAMTVGLCFLAALTLMGGAAAAEKEKRKSTEFVDPMIHHISIITDKTFDLVVRKARNENVFVVLFYQQNDETKKLIDGTYDKLAKSLKGMVTVGALNCDKAGDFCEKNGVTKYPTIMLYPLNPQPPIPYSGDVVEGEILKQVYRLIPSNIQTITTGNVDTFLSENPAVPKVILFSEKKNPPVLYKSLSNSFVRKLSFGFVHGTESTNEVLLTRWKVKKMPHLMVLRTGDKPLVYTKTLNFEDIHNWLNVHAETFVMGGGFSDGGASVEAQPWLVQRIPEVTMASHQDICFRQANKSRGLCVIYTKDGDHLTEEEIAMLVKMSDSFVSRLSDRGAQFRWMWMNMAVETHFKELFNFQTSPSLAVFNPHKRLRFLTLEESVVATEETIIALLDKIVGGDTRFTNVKNKKLPPFAVREQPSTKGNNTPGKDEL